MPLEQAFHVLSVDEVASQLETDIEQGLTSAEAHQRSETYGANRLHQGQTRSPWMILIDQFKSIVILILVAAAIAAFVTARWPEGIALVAVTIINTLIGFFSEWKAVRSMEALRKLTSHETEVIRDGKAQTVDVETLVPGDLIQLYADDLIAADARFVSAEQLRINEAALTGESIPVLKGSDPVDRQTPLAERTNMLYKGTSVTEGNGKALVVAIGMDTELGKISQLAEEAQSQDTPLQRKLDKLGSRLAWITLFIATVVAIAGLAAGRDPVTMIETAIALGIAAVPEGLPIVATIALARGMWLMAKRNAIVNRLTAVETLGATRIILTDKTGTLTENKMAVAKIVTPHHEIDLKSQEDSSSAGSSSIPSVERLLRIGVLCNNATLDEGQGGDATGDPTEIALLAAGAEFELQRDMLLDELPEVQEIPFTSETMMMGTLHRNGDANYLAVKGSPEAVLRASSFIGDDESDRPFTEKDRDQWLKRADQLASKGLRLLAGADAEPADISDQPFQSLHFVGLFGLVDPPRDDVKAAIQECQSAGMRVIMVTGDRPDTGLAVGEQVGLTQQGKVMHGDSLLADGEQLTPEQKNEILNADVFARVTPAQKLQLVKLYQDEGDVVAMTGDGVNDAPALKQADIGVAMGKRGTDAAKQVADMVLRDDQFKTIVAAVEEGRIIFANIRKSVVFMLCTNLAEILIVTVASLAQLPMPLLPLQILFLNVLTDVFPALALGIGAGGKNVMKHPVRDPRESVLTGHHAMVIGIWSGVIGACVLSALLIALFALDFDHTTAVTISFLTLAFSKLWFVSNLRDRDAKPWDNDVVRNPWVWLALAICATLLVSSVYLPPLAKVLHTKPPGINGWLVILGVSFVPALIGFFVPGIRFYSVSRKSHS